MIAALAPVRPHHANRGRWVVFGASVAIGAIAGLAQFNTRSGFNVGFGDGSTARLPPQPGHVERPHPRSVFERAADHHHSRQG